MKDWHHAPVHRLSAAGAYIVTAGTYEKVHYFREPERLTLVHDMLLSLAERYGWELQAWAIMSNHYHFVGTSPDDSLSLRALIRHLHSCTAIEVNRMDGTEGRKVWHAYWDTHLTYEKSFLARLNYVHQNPVKHGLVQMAEQYPWCSAAWFARTADPAFYETVTGFRIDRVNVGDDFDAD